MQGPQKSLAKERSSAELRFAPLRFVPRSIVGVASPASRVCDERLRRP